MNLVAPSDVANVRAEVLAAGAVLVRLEEGIVDGEEEDALPGPGVHLLGQRDHGLDGQVLVLEPIECRPRFGEVDDVQVR